jgi:hypothetical protein
VINEIQHPFAAVVAARSRISATGCAGPSPGSDSGHQRPGQQGRRAGDGVQAAGAEQRWRAVNGAHLAALVRAGASFEKGKLVERPKEAPDKRINEVAA